MRLTILTISKCIVREAHASVGLGFGKPPLATQAAPATSSVPWGRHRVGDTSHLEACAARVSAPGGEEMPEADPGRGRSQVSLGCQVSSGDSGQRRGATTRTCARSRSWKGRRLGLQQEPKVISRF